MANRKLSLESLEDRTLLAVTAGLDVSAYDPMICTEWAEIQVPPVLATNSDILETNSKMSFNAAETSDATDYERVADEIEKINSYFNNPSYVQTATKDYALYFAGGVSFYSNHYRYYANMVDFYYTLTTELAIAPENIYILYADGTDSGADREDDQNSDMTFATNYGTEVYSATSANLSAVMDTISALMDEESHFLFFSFDHGSGITPEDSSDYATDCDDYLCGWEDSELIIGADVAEQIFKVQEGYVTCVFSECFAGGILDDIYTVSTGDLNEVYTGNAHFYGMAATNHYEPSYSDGYAKAFVSAISPKEGRLLDTEEVFAYAKANDPYAAQYETYAPNEGVYTDDEHPWGMGESFDIFGFVSVYQYIVTTTDDVVDPEDGLLSLREAISYAEEGDTIAFASELAGEVITLSGTELAIDKGITINASSIGGMAIDAGSKSRVFNITGSTEGGPVKLIGLTIVGGSADNGGGVSTCGTLTLVDCDVAGNSARLSGGGVCNYGSGTLSMVNCTVSDNSASYGGGVYNTDDGKCVLTDCAVAGNSADRDGGGARNVVNGTLILTNCVVSGNDAGVNGGGLYTNGTLTLTNCSVAGNTSGERGGGIFSDGPRTALSSCIIEYNQAFDGGGVYTGGGFLTSTNSVFFGNTAYGGGGIFNVGEFESINCTISGNSASIGGGVYNYGGFAITLINSIVSFNDAKTGNDLYQEGEVYGNNNIIGGDPGFTVAPVFESGDLVNAGDVDLTLTSESAVINAGDNSAVTSQYDLAGNLRIDAGIVDIGAYEYQSGNLVVTTAEDVISDSDGLLSLREAIQFATEGYLITFDSSLTDQTIVLSGSGLSVRTGITIDASSIGGMTIDADFRSRVFYVSGGSSSAPVELIGLTITGGYTNGYGGGVYNSGSLLLTNCTITGNTASDDGGGIYNDKGTLTLTNCAITGNDAYDDGGGIYSYYGTQTLTNCTVVGNDSGYWGGGICSSGSSSETYLYNTIVAQNTASRDGNDIYSGTLYAYNTLSSFTNWTDSSFCPDYDPSLPLFVDAAGGDYRLLPGSQAVDTGSNGYIAGYDTDLAGNPRIRNGVVDLGAYECQWDVSDIETPSTVVTTNLDIVDLTDNLISLREAISYAADGKTITFDSSLAGQTITLSEGELSIGKKIAIDASSIGGMTIDADSRSRVFYVTGGSSSAPVELIGLSITGGETSNSDDGGGVYNSGMLLLTNCTVTGNGAADDGGGVYNSGTLTLTNCTITENTSVDDGGGIYSYYGTLILTDCTIAGNDSGYWGGGICNSSGTLTLTNSIVSENTSRYSGGGIRNSGMLILANCTIVGNGSKTDDGGGIYNSSGTLTLTHCMITENTAENDGGGIYNSSGRLRLIDCAITENTSVDDGGGIYNGGTLTLTNCAVTDNTSVDDGGGIYNYDGTQTLTNCTVAGNDSGYWGGGICSYSSSSETNLYNTIVAQNTASVYGNDIYSGSLYAYNTLSSFTNWTDSSYCEVYDSSRPLFADAAAGGDYTLAPGSQAVGVGNNTYITGYETDLNGNTRIVNGTVDLGAYEYQGNEQPAVPTILTGRNGVYASYGSNRHQISWSPLENVSGYELAYSTDGRTWTSVETSETSPVITGLTYGDDVTYRVRALGTGSFADSEWSGVKSFKVCPMDINGDGDISGADRVLMAAAWLSGEGDEEFRYFCDINGDGDISNGDRVYLANNWLCVVEEDAEDLLFPPASRADAVFAEFGSGDFERM